MQRARLLLLLLVPACGASAHPPEALTVTVPPASATSPAAHAQVTVAAPKEERPAPRERAKGVIEIGPNEFEVEREYVDSLLESSSPLMPGVRLVPETVQGVVVGIRMFGIRESDGLGVLGFQNGDLLRRVNGRDIASPDKALEAYANARNADLLEVEITRRGQELTLRYHLHRANGD